MALIIIQAMIILRRTRRAMIAAVAFMIAGAATEDAGEGLAEAVTVAKELPSHLVAEVVRLPTPS